MNEENFSINVNIYDQLPINDHLDIQIWQILFLRNDIQKWKTNLP